MYYLRILFYATCGFFGPVIMAAHFGPKWFTHAIPESSQFANTYYSPRASLAEKTASLSEETDNLQSPEPQSGCLTIVSDPALDPQRDHFFVVSMNFKISALPRTGKRQKLIAKYADDSSPYPGWAIAIRRLNTSTRPEVYWQNRGGKGGWHTFDDVHFSKHQWYSLTLVAKDSDLISLYVEKLESKPIAEDGGEEEDTEIAQTVRFLGGYNVSSIAFDPTSARLEFSPPLFENGDYRGEVRNILVAQPVHLPLNQNKLQELLQGGSIALHHQLQAEDVALWIDESGQDLSKARRSIVPQALHS